MGRLSETITEHKFISAGLLAGAILLGDNKGLYDIDFNPKGRAADRILRAAETIRGAINSNNIFNQSVSDNPVIFGNPSASGGEVLFEETFDGPDAFPYATRETNETHDKWFVEHLEGTGFDRQGGIGIEDETGQFFRTWIKEAYGGEGEGLLVRMRVRTDSINERPGNIHEGTKAQIRFAAPDAPEEGVAKLKGDFDRGPGTYTFVFHTNDGFMEISKRKTGVDETSDAYQFYESENVPYEIGTWEDIEWTIEWLEDGTNRLCLWRKNIQDDPIVVVRDTEPDAAMRGPGNVGIRTDDTQSSWDAITIERLNAPRPGCE